MATTRTPELPLDPATTGGPPQWITTIAHCCDTYSQTRRADTPVWETVTPNPARSRSPQAPPPATAPSPSLTV